MLGNASCLLDLLNANLIFTMKMKLEILLPGLILRKIMKPRLSCAICTVQGRNQARKEIEHFCPLFQNTADNSEVDNLVACMGFQEDTEIDINEDQDSIWYSGSR